VYLLSRSFDYANPLKRIHSAQDDVFNVMWNPFKKVKQSASNAAIGMAAKIAEKKMRNMSPQEQQKMMQEAFKPENKEKLLAVMEQMRRSGQISEEQYNLAKQKLGF